MHCALSSLWKSWSKLELLISHPCRLWKTQDYSAIESDSVCYAYFPSFFPSPFPHSFQFLPSFFNVGANNHPPFSLNDDFFLTWGRMVRNGDAVLWKGVRHEGCTCWVNWAYMWSFSSNKTCTSGHSGLSDSGGSPELRPHSAYGKLATPPPRVCV